MHRPNSRSSTAHHPCFFSKDHSRYGRIHLPVAPSCNIQCVYCRRDHACPNENRPGVCSRTITPDEALTRLEIALADMPYITVAGIAGPGDAFDDPELTLRTFELIRRAHSDIALCVSTNGLMIKEVIGDLQALDVRFVTVTINAIDPGIGSLLYQRVQFGGKMLHGVEAAQLLIDRQMEAVALLKEKHFTVKINSVVVPGMNMHHILFLAKRLHRLGVDLMNLLPLIPLPATPMENTAPPSTSQMKRLQMQAGRYVPQMRHCQRCRSDAAGKLNEDHMIRFEC